MPSWAVIGGHSEATNTLSNYNPQLGVEWWTNRYSDRATGVWPASLSYLTGICWSEPVRDYIHSERSGCELRSITDLLDSLKTYGPCMYLSLWWIKSLIYILLTILLIEICCWKVRLLPTFLFRDQNFLNVYNCIESTIHNCTFHFYNYPKKHGNSHTKKCPA